VKISRVLMACGVGITLLFGTSGVAGAIQYGADFVLPQADGTTQVHVESFAPGVNVEVRLVCPIATTLLTSTTAEADGTITVYVTLPANVDGCSINVVGGAVDKSFPLAGALPATGNDAGSLLQVGFGLLALGLIIVGVGQLRRRVSPQVA